MNVHLRNRPPSLCAARLAGMVVGVAGLVCFGLPGGGSARAEEGILVQGTGAAKARPTEVEIVGGISAEAELATDATVKFRDAKKRALAAFAALKNPDLTIVPGGVSVSSGLDANAQMMAMRGMAVASTNPKVKLAEMDRIVLANVDKIETEALLEKVLKILDVAKDSGFQVGPSASSNYYEIQMRMQNGEGNTVVTFKLPNGAALRDQAYRAAIEDAKGKAKKLAELAGVKLGRVISLREEAATGEGATAMSLAALVYGLRSSANKNAETDLSIAGPTSGELALRVNLTVQFEIVK